MVIFFWLLKNAVIPPTWGMAVIAKKVIDQIAAIFKFHQLFVLTM